MKRFADRIQTATLTVAITLALLLTIGAALLPATAGAGSLNRITGAELTAMIERGEQPVIVDVREPWRYDKGHIPGAINIQYEDNSHTRILNELSPMDTIVFVCHGGPMGDELGNILVGKGYPRVYNLKRGMRGWKGTVEGK
jgi:rhodanese-related sulfurtransferase